MENNQSTESYKSILSTKIEKTWENFNLNNINKDSKFWKINFLEANAVGQIGESFFKELFSINNIKIKDTKEIIHDEYDILIEKSNLKIDIKTARKGKTNNTFQFNGIDPNYNYDYIICFGITDDEFYIKIIDKKNEIKYDHSKRSYYYYGENSSYEKPIKLVNMNPNNMNNKKLTLSTKKMDDFSKFNIFVNFLKA
ncbi:MAG: restriction endonuclease [Mycoplasmataceae bacterium]|nr:restriction endonuclease [Mycoplasmataceae bacterium]